MYTAIKPLVKTILENPLGYEWSLQGLGMLRLYLSDNLRLHVWNNLFAVPNVSIMHTHPWDFTSTVIAGEVMNMKFVECAKVDQHTKGDGQLFKRQMIHCGVGGGLMGEPETIYLRLEGTEGYREGESYFEKAEEIHVSVPAQGSVTLIERHFKEDRDHAYVFWSDGEWVSAEPRRATNLEVKAITEHSLKNWF